jgi:prepilin-type N-terminal cleavage/methylation domain-containing protein
VTIRLPHPSAESGFTIVEVMVAMVILVVGLLGVASMLTKAAQSTASSKAREQGVALQRELVEGARGIAYGDLTPSSVVGRLQSQPGLGDADAEAGWNIKRRGVTYTVAAGVCSVDDSKDGIGSHDAGTFCVNGTGTTSPATCRSLLGGSGDIFGASGAATAGAAAGDCGIDLNQDGGVDNLVNATATTCTGTCSGGGQPDDSNPDDFKRVVTLVRWKTGEGLRYALQSTTLPYPGVSGAPRVTNLTTTATIPVTEPTVTSLPFTVTTNRTAQTVAWSLDGSPAGTAAGLRTTSFTFAWNIGALSGGSAPGPNEVVDGDYVVSAKAFDPYGAYGAIRVKTVTLNRRQPYGPRNFKAAMVDDVVETEWTQSPERDVQGYQLYRRPESGGDVLVVDTGNRATAARDSSGRPTTGTWTYFAKAVDKDPGGSLRAGDASVLVTLPLDNHSPRRPTNVVVTQLSGQVQLTWSAPAAPQDPDAGDAITQYMIYRDGQRLADQFATTTATTYTDTTASDGPHTYWVAAVDSRLAQSARVAAVEAGP